MYSAFRKQHAKYRRPEAVSDSTLRDMVRNFHPDVGRTKSGYFKNLSVKPVVDPFTGKAGGFVAEAPRAAAAGVTSTSSYASGDGSSNSTKSNSSSVSGSA